MAAWADDEQEVTELVIIPLLTFATFWGVGLPLGFYEWWICSEYVVFSEIIGHSGIRVHTIAPSPISWLLRLCDAELAIEDHDLHHRFGWRKSFNYGKQTTLWDKIFSSKYPRLESRETNVDYEDIVWMPIF
ncbi:fatty acid hydroxylase superfamily protein [Beauveria brongniartii RCEF 3172]|uniref:Fatty acid hydroxylase superfamily protein n=1 Tax=Beauveria brongniartii RCEF 3172 TaxID=1081107 RepID=A0A166RWY2_9HYPO|nr:fatty acid hydroxylase superfamily protein [Beauveria brongniartii RCEF 3172]